MIAIDHVTLGVQNLYEGYMGFRRETGVPVLEGGYFPAFGLADMAAPLGDGAVIRIASVIDYRVAQHDVLGSWVDAQVEHGDRWLGFGLRVDDEAELSTLAERLGSTVRHGIADAADAGERSSAYRALDGTDIPIAPHVPDAGAYRRGLPLVTLRAVAEAGSAGPGSAGGSPGPLAAAGSRIAWLEIGGTAAQFAELLGIEPEALSIRCDGGAPGVHAVCIVAGGREVVIRHD